MASPSSQRKSGSSSSREEIASLLRDGAIHRDPTAEMLKAASLLEKLGLARPLIRQYVLCSDPQDSDFPPRQRHCQGRIYLEENLDEPGCEYRCPECDRPVFPQRYGKRGHKELRSRIVPDGVKSFVRNEMAKLQVNVKDVAESTFRIDLGNMGVVVCILDYCHEDRFHSRDWAKTHPTCYLNVNPDYAERFLPEKWLTRISLADIVVGKVNLDEALRELASAGSPAAVMDASVPVYSKTVAPVVVDPGAGHGKQRRFVVEVGPKTVRVGGEEVVAPQADIRFEVFRILWDRHLEDLRGGRKTEDFTPMRLSDIVKKVEERTQREIEDETSIRRAINRLQADIEKAFKKKVGDPIDREDIIETCAWKGQQAGESGYRINPRTVCVRPFQEVSE